MFIPFTSDSKHTGGQLLVTIVIVIIYITVDEEASSQYGITLKLLGITLSTSTASMYMRVLAFRPATDEVFHLKEDNTVGIDSDLQLPPAICSNLNSKSGSSPIGTLNTDLISWKISLSLISDDSLIFPISQFCAKCSLSDDLRGIFNVLSQSL